MRPLTPKEEDLLARYRERLENEFGNPEKGKKKKGVHRAQTSSSYREFKKATLPKQFGIYEQFCNKSVGLLKINPGEKSAKQLKKDLTLSHIDTTPEGVFSLSVLTFLVILAIFAFLGFVLKFGGTFMVLYGLIVGLLVLSALMKIPEYLANSWRLKASNEMVQCVFFIVTYMRHTSNLEMAVRFASDHLDPPLSLDLKKVLWDVETARYPTVQESLDNYLESWKSYSPEFIEAFHLVEGSLYESSESKRLNMIDKSLSVMLQETYEKMLRYTHELKGPVTMLYMLGIILPVLGLIILPLVASFMTNDVPPMKLALYIALLYNFSMPVVIYYLGKMVLSKRPTGYGDTDLTQAFPELKKYGKVNLTMFQRTLLLDPSYFAFIIGAVIVFIGLIPLFLGFIIPPDVLLDEPDIFPALGWKILEYRQSSTGAPGDLVGPYGFVASLLSGLIPLGIGLGLGLFYKLRSKNVITIRNKTKQVEAEFASALFQLGNRLGDGLPPEIAFGKVAQVTEGSETGKFFELVHANITARSMDVETAIFDKRYGAIKFFPSSIIRSSMKVLIESAKKGPRIASQAMINVSEYIKDIHRVDERLKDLLAELISDMKQQVKILAPAIAGIVVGITSMIVNIIGNLTDQISTIASQDIGGAQVPAGILSLFGDGIPTYYFQTIVGIYIVQITYILTMIISSVENGSDKLAEHYELGQNLFKGTIVYVVLSTIVVFIFNIVAGSILTIGLN